MIILIPGAGSSGADIFLPPNMPMSGIISGEPYFKTFGEDFESMGFDTFVCPKNHHEDQASIEERMKMCQVEIAKINPCVTHESAFVLGHSLGGIVAMDLVTADQLNSKPQLSCVKAIVTISTPFKGTELGDFVLEQENADTVYGRTLRFFHYTSQNNRYLAETTTNHRYVLSDSVHVPIYSIANNMSPDRLDFLAPTQKIIADRISSKDTNADTRNDGIVPTRSMIAGQLIGIVNATHFESACLSIYAGSSGCADVRALLKGFFKKTVGLSDQLEER